METIKQIDVHLNFTSNPIEVGQLLLENGTIYFKFNTSFLERNLDISPFKLKQSQEILTSKTSIFNGLFGVFNDSLPDGWGNLLLDRTLISKGLNIIRITPLDRLAYIGQNGMGALTYKPSLNPAIDSDTPLNIDEISKEMNHIITGTPSDIIEELFQLGGSSGGARPKAFVGFNPNTNHLVHGHPSLPQNYEHWIIKFPSSYDLPDIANIEYAYYKMALAAGIKMSECKLFRSTSGNSYFATKRFDRIHNNRLHLHSASGLLNDNFRFSNLDYGNIMDCAFHLENHVTAYSKVLRLAAFNIYSHNRDDHSKNIAFLMNSQGQWSLAPAFDLTFSNSSHGMHSTMVAGESKFPGEKHLLELAKTFGIKNPKTIIQEVKNAVENWNTYAKDANVTENSRKLIDKTIKGIIEN